MRPLISHQHQQPTPESDSDATGSSEGVDYYLQMYFGQSYDGLSAPHQPGHRAPTGIAEEGSLLPQNGATRNSLETELASILFGPEEPSSADSSDLSPAYDDRLAREAPPAPAQCSSTGRWSDDSSCKEQQLTQDHDQPTLRNIHPARLSQSQADEPDVRGSTRTTATGTGSSEDGKQEKITQTQTQPGLSGDSSKENSSYPSLSYFSSFDQDDFHPFLSFPSPSSPSSATKNNSSSTSRNNNNNLENCFSVEYNTTSPSGGGGTTIQDFKPSSSTNLLNHPISSAISISADARYQSTPHHPHPIHSLDTTIDCYPLDPIRPSFDLLHQMSTSSYSQPPPKTQPLDLSQFWSDFTPSSTRTASAKATDPVASESEDNQQPVELEFSHLVAEEQCAPSTPLSSSSFSYEPAGVTSSDHSSQSIPKRSPKSSDGFGRPFVPADPLSSLFATTDPGTSLYPHHQSITSFQDLREFNDTFHNLLNSFDLFTPAASSPHPSILPSGQPPPLSAPFLSTTASVSTRSTPAIDPAFASQPQTSPSAVHLTHHKDEPSLTSTSPLPSPASLSLSGPQSGDQCRRTSEVIHPNHHHKNLLISRSASYSALNKPITAAAEVPTEVELAIPRLNRLNLSEPYPGDLKLLLIGLQAEGAKTRVETQIKLTLVLVTGEGASIDQNGGLSTSTQHSLSRLGNWSHIKLPVYSAIKRKSKKLIKTGIPPEETLFLDVAVVRESEPQEEIYCCSNCQVREQKRLQRKRDARVRPAQEIESDEAEQSIRPEDEKRKIVVFNCGQYVSFDSGEVTLPTRITCYCRHHREKRGFRVKITLRDHTNRFVATATTPAIMITDDHKAVAAAAKARSGSDAEDSQVRPRPIRKLPTTGPASGVSGAHRTKKRSITTSGESNSQLASTPAQDDGSYGSTPRWTPNAAANDYLHLQSHRSISTSCKRKAPDELNLRVNIGKRTGSHQTATINQMIGPCDASLADKSSEFDGDYQIIPPPGSSRSLEECSPPLAHQLHQRSYDRTVSMPMHTLPPDMRQPISGSNYQWKECPSIPKQSYQEHMPVFSRPDAKPILSIDVEMKDPSENARSQPTDKRFQSLTSIDETRSIDYSTSATDISEILHKDQESRPSEHSSQGDRAHSAIQHIGNNYGRSHPSCSTTTSSPDQRLACPFGSRIATPPPSGSSEASPKPFIDFPGYDHHAKFSNSTSRSSSIVCTQSRGCSDESNNGSEVDRTLCILPSQSENSPDQQPVDQIDAHSNHPNEVSRTGSPVENSPMCVLGSSLTNWNVNSGILPQASVTSASLKPSVTQVPAEARGGSVSIHPAVITDRSQATGSVLKNAQARIRKLVPNEGPVEGGIEITILGENFDRDLRVDFGGVGGPVRPEFWSANTLVCTLPSVAGPGPCEVVLVDGNGPVQYGEACAPARLFKYVCTADQRLMEVALQVVGLKMTGQVQDAIHFARRIVVETHELDGFHPLSSNFLIENKEG
ncbi:hypothetical protein PtA15_1A115 [Puccinia triticina]|uniref:IPT/TIG domain-containing protein n=1 Tax=Puccinia triticina TaxID=208348 RepID=A0ABY7CA37_9BASI|nr:uncharacterized protein PtA15_1A115 [Puccinia triticina]WAQ80777.1 hypothetical protein PtA15_1A115 [Puccinia triticina]